MIVQKAPTLYKKHQHCTQSGIQSSSLSHRSITSAADGGVIAAEVRGRFAAAAPGVSAAEAEDGRFADADPESRPNSPATLLSTLRTPLNAPAEPAGPAARAESSRPDAAADAAAAPELEAAACSASSCCCTVELELVPDVAPSAPSSAASAPSFFLDSTSSNIVPALVQAGVELSA